VYTNSSPSLSCTTLKSLSKYTTATLQLAGLPWFHGSSFQTAPTGTFTDQIHSPKPCSPGTGFEVVYSTSISSLEPGVTRHFDAVMTQPPNVGRSLNHPRMGITVREKREVSNSLRKAKKRRKWGAKRRRRRRRRKGSVKNTKGVAALECVLNRLFSPL